MVTGFTDAGIDIDTPATQLQHEGAASFIKSWDDLMSWIEGKGAGRRAHRSTVGVLRSVGRGMAAEPKLEA